jgi:large subunit ribosomal protein L20
MPRSVPKVASRNRRKKLLRRAKGNWGARGNVLTVAKHTVEKGLAYAFRDRRAKKRLYRAIWIQRLNAAAREHGMSYSEFIGKIHKNNVGMNRKTLADLAMNHPEAFASIVKSLK